MSMSNKNPLKCTIKDFEIKLNHVLRIIGRGCILYEILQLIVFKT